MKSTRNCSKESLNIIAGSVLAISLDNSQWALGQVVIPGINFYIGFPLALFDEPVFAVDIERYDLRLFSWTNDAEVFRGNWNNIGQAEVVSHIYRPEYLINLEGKLFVESFDGSRYREFDEEIDKELKYRKSRSPSLVEKGVRAALGLEEPNMTSKEMLAQELR